MRFLALVLAICLLPGLTMAQNSVLEKPMESWARVPGGTVWLNPGDAYEHDTGLVRDQYGRRHAPVQPNAVQPSQRWVSPQPNRPYWRPQPYCPNCPQHYPQPYYAPAPNWQRFDYGPYQRRPYGYGAPMGSIDPLAVPKTGDAPLAR